MRTVACTAAFAALLTGPAFADGGPMSEPGPSPDPAPVYEPAPVSSAGGHFYAAAAGGMAWLSDIEVDIGIPAVTSTAVIESDSGWAALGALGYDFGTGPRIEVEVGYGANDGLLSADFDGGVLLADSRLKALDIMANLIYSMPDVSSVRPYIGVGAGAARVSVEFDDGNPLPESESWAFAYQLIGGVAMPLADSAELFVDYRFLATAGLETDLEPIYENMGEYQRHNVLGGVRFAF